MSHLYIFRMRLERSEQVEAFGETTRSQVLKQSLIEFPTYEDGWKRIWRIGDIDYINNKVIYFRLGRESGEIEPEYDEQKASFIESEHRPAPYTDVFLALDSQYVALRHEWELGRTPQTIANRLADLLRRASAMRTGPFSLAEINQIPDPHDFIQQLRDAYAIRTFTFWFSKPNFASERDLTKKLEHFEEVADEIGAPGGRTVFNAEDLDREAAAEMTKAVTSRGEDVSAQIQRSNTSEPSTIHAKEENPRTIEVDRLESHEDKMSAVQLFLRTIDKILGRK